MEPCEKCGALVEIGMFPFCKGSPSDHGFPSGHTGVPFKAFDLEVDGKVHHFASLHQVREFERESGRRAANGEGQQFAFRAYNNEMEGGGQTKNVFGPPPFKKFSTRDRYGRPYITRVGKSEGEGE